MMNLLKDQKQLSVMSVILPLSLVRTRAAVWSSLSSLSIRAQSASQL